MQGSVECIILKVLKRYQDKRQSGQRQSDKRQRRQTSEWDKRQRNLDFFKLCRFVGI